MLKTFKAFRRERVVSRSSMKGILTLANSRSVRKGSSKNKKTFQGSKALSRKGVASGSLI